MTFSIFYFHFHDGINVSYWPYCFLCEVSMSFHACIYFSEIKHGQNGGHIYDVGLIYGCRNVRNSNSSELSVPSGGLVHFLTRIFFFFMARRDWIRKILKRVLGTRSFIPLRARKLSDSQWDCFVSWAFTWWRTEASDSARQSPAQRASRQRPACVCACLLDGVWKTMST